MAEGECDCLGFAELKCGCGDGHVVGGVRMYVHHYRNSHWNATCMVEDLNQRISRLEIALEVKTRELSTFKGAMRIILNVFGGRPIWEGVE